MKIEDSIFLSDNLITALFPSHKKSTQLIEKKLIKVRVNETTKNVINE
jgi:hypothetical protein